MTELYRLLLNSERPFLFIGNGCRNIERLAELREYCEANAIPFVITSHAHGIIKEKSPVHFGSYGLGANDQTVNAVSEYRADLILYLGSQLNELPTMGWSKDICEVPMKIHVDRDRSVFGRRVQADLNLEMDLDNFISELLKFDFESEQVVERRARLDELNPARPKDSSYLPERFGVHPINLMRWLSTSLPEDAIIVCDIGNAIVWSVGYLELNGQQDYYLPFGLSSMGAGICAAIGAKAAHPDRPVVAIVGDGAMMMHGSELVSAVTNKLPITTVVLNDRGHGMVDHGLKMFGLPVSVRYEQKVDFCKWGESLGCQVATVNHINDLEQLSPQFETDQCQVIEVNLDETIAPPIGSRMKIIGEQEKHAN